MRNTHLLGMSLMLPAILVAVMTAGNAEAKEGFYLGAGIVFSDIGGAVNDGSTIYSGDGAGLTAGYGINEYVAVEAQAWSTDHDLASGGKVDLKAAQLGIKASLPEESHVKPYLVLGAGKYVLGESRGEGWRYGIGVDIGLSTAFTLVIGIERHVFDLGSAPRVSAEATTMTIGITYLIL